MSKFSLSDFITCFTCCAFGCAFSYVTWPLVPILGITGACVAVIIEAYKAFKERQKNNNQKQDQKKIIALLENRTAVLSKAEINALFKAVLTQFSLRPENICEIFSRNSYSEQILSDFFAHFSPEQKMELLLKKVQRSESSLCRCLLSQNYYPTLPLLKALMKGLSPKQYQDLISHNIELPGDKILYEEGSKLFDVLASLFKEISIEDKLKFLETDPTSKPILLKILDAFYKIYVVKRDNGRYFQSHLQRCYDKEKLLQANKLKFLTILFKGIPAESLKVILAVKHASMGPLDVGLTTYIMQPYNNIDIPILNFLIENGALEADPEYDVEKLLKHPNINLTPYRNTIESRLKQANLPDHMAQVRDLICDYLTGETPKQTKVIQKIH